MSEDTIKEELKNVDKKIDEINKKIPGSSAVKDEGAAQKDQKQNTANLSLDFEDLVVIQKALANLNLPVREAGRALPTLHKVDEIVRYISSKNKEE